MCRDAPKFGLNKKSRISPCFVSSYEGKRREVAPPPERPPTPSKVLPVAVPSILYVYARAVDARAATRALIECILAVRPAPIENQKMSKKYTLVSHIMQQATQEKFLQLTTRVSLGNETRSV